MNLPWGEKQKGPTQPAGGMGAGFCSWWLLPPAGEKRSILPFPLKVPCLAVLGSNASTGRTVTTCGHPHQPFGQSVGTCHSSWWWHWPQHTLSTSTAEKLGGREKWLQEGLGSQWPLQGSKAPFPLGIGEVAGWGAQAASTTAGGSTKRDRNRNWPQITAFTEHEEFVKPHVSIWNHEINHK